MKDRCKDELSIVNCQLSISEFLRKDEQKDLLRLLTAGSVDDGKSTLIGRLLFDSKKLYEDQLDALERDSKRMGNANKASPSTWHTATSRPTIVSLSLPILRDTSSTHAT